MNTYTIDVYETRRYTITVNASDMDEAHERAAEECCEHEADDIYVDHTELVDWERGVEER